MKTDARPTSGHANPASTLEQSKGTAPIADPIPAQWRWHHRMLLNLHDRLLLQRNGLLHAVGQPLEPHSMNEADSATDEFDHDLALAQLSAQHDALYEINQALERIHRGTYGICEETRKMIPDARLKAVPWTRFTMKVEQRLEKEKLLHSIHLNAAATARNDGLLSFASEDQDSDDESAQSPGSADRKK
ncbi:MAG: TraR/DksA family transcriptional regulator [Verrucomicrobiota bacterium]